jgi:predicted metal-dependent HD superfamily phosphohydrolase
VIEGPPWLTGSFLRATRDLGAEASQPQIIETAESLLRLWLAPQRQYHTLRHLVDMLTRIDELAPEAIRPACVRLAAFYHGAVFDPPAPDDGPEQADLAMPFAANWEDTSASARLAQRQLSGIGIAPELAERVGDLVRTLDKLAVLPRDADSAVLVDAALGQLAADPQRYAEYQRQVRQENQAVSDEVYLNARLASLSHLMDRPALFHTTGASGWENAARDNISGEISRVRRQLLKLRDLG